MRSKVMKNVDTCVFLFSLLCFCSSLYATRAYFIKAGLDFDHKLAFFENCYCYKNTFNI